MNAIAAVLVLLAGAAVAAPQKPLQYRQPKPGVKEYNTYQLQSQKPSAVPVVESPVPPAQPPQSLQQPVAPRYRQEQYGVVPRKEQNGQVAEQEQYGQVAGQEQYGQITRQEQYGVVPRKEQYGVVPRKEKYRPEPHVIVILKQSQEDNFDGSFNYNFEAENGISVQGQGYLKDAGTETEAQVIQGTYSYTAPDGTPIVTNWYADETGFHAEGAHLPVPPPLPEAIAKVVAYHRSLPQTEEKTK